MSQNAAQAKIVVLETRRAARRVDALGHFRPASALSSERTRSEPVAVNEPAALAASIVPDMPEDGSLHRRRRPLVFALTLSLLSHGSLVAWMLWSTPSTDPGAGGRELETVSVDLISATALESISARPNAGAAGATSPVAAAPGIGEAPPQIEIAAATAAPKPEQSTEPEAPPPLLPDIQALPEPAPDAALVASEPPPTPVVEPSKKVEPEPRKETPQTVDEQKTETQAETAAVAASEAQPATAPGGATARVETESIEADSSAGASSGELARYALEVRLALGRARPRHGGAKGRVLISFALTEAGLVRQAEITRSSGSNTVDEAAITAVRTTAFPPPPSGSTDAQRSYTVPFEFK